MRWLLLILLSTSLLSQGKKLARKKTSHELIYSPESVSTSSIVAEHGEMQTGGRRFPELAASLAYITPWNSAGYDRAVALATKLSHVSPVWLQLVPSGDGESRSCKIQGQHDIDHGWMQRLRDANPNLKIVPRVIFEGWEPKELEHFLGLDEWNYRCMKDLSDILTRNDFDGVVLELWLTALSATNGEEKMLLELLSFWGDELHKMEKQLIVPIPAPIRGDMKHNAVIFNSDYMAKLASHVDYIQVMTYDYSSPGSHAFPQSPLHWFEANIHACVGDNAALASQLLLGLNHYGLRTDYAAQSQDHITGNGFLELAQKLEAELVWDDEAKEHELRVGKIHVYYPSLTSLELRTITAIEYGTGIAIWELGQGLNYFSRLL